MVDYDFPNGLYIRVVEVHQGVKAEVYRRVETEEEEVLHMKRVGLIWLREKERTLKGLVERLKDKSSWDSHS